MVNSGVGSGDGVNAVSEGESGQYQDSSECEQAQSDELGVSQQVGKTVTG